MTTARAHCRRGAPRVAWRPGRGPTTLLGRYVFQLANEPGAARFVQAAIARVGQCVALAVDEVAQVMFEAVLPC